MPTCHWNWQKKARFHNKQTLLLLLQEVFTMRLWAVKRANRESQLLRNDWWMYKVKKVMKVGRREKSVVQETLYLLRRWKTFRQSLVKIWAMYHCLCSFHVVTNTYKQALQFCNFPINVYILLNGKS